jgi:hypothetical protein
MHRRLVWHGPVYVVIMERSLYRECMLRRPIYTCDLKPQHSSKLCWRRNGDNHHLYIDVYIYLNRNNLNHTAKFIHGIDIRKPGKRRKHMGRMLYGYWLFTVMCREWFQFKFGNIS